MESQSETNNRSFKPHWIWGGLLVILGTLFLLGQVFPGLGAFLWGVIWAAALGAGGIFMYGIYLSNRKQWWALIPAYVMWVVAGALVIFGMLPFLRGVLIASYVMFATGLPFLYVYIRDNKQWWALIPAYTMCALGMLIPLMPILNGFQIAAAWHLAIAVPFLYVYLRNNKHWWALIPGGIMGTISLVFFLIGSIYLIAVAMIVVGIFLLVRQFGGQKSLKAEAPRYGPEADKPASDFEPIEMPEREINQG